MQPGLNPGCFILRRNVDKMADYHILNGVDTGNKFRVIMHFPVPDIVNGAGINYRLALIEMLGGSQTSVVPFIEGAEQTQLNAGELYEHVVMFNTHPGEILEDKQIRLDALWESERVAVQAKIQYMLSYWGYSRTIV